MDAPLGKTGRAFARATLQAPPIISRELTPYIRLEEEEEERSDFPIWLQTVIRFINKLTSGGSRAGIKKGGYVS